MTSPSSKALPLPSSDKLWPTALTFPAPGRASSSGPVQLGSTSVLPPIHAVEVPPPQCPPPSFSLFVWKDEPSNYLQTDFLSTYWLSSTGSTGYLQNVLTLMIWVSQITEAEPQAAAKLGRVLGAFQAILKNHPQSTSWPEMTYEIKILGDI